MARITKDEDSRVPHLCDPEHPDVNQVWIETQNGHSGNAEGKEDSKRACRNSRYFIFQEAFISGELSSGIFQRARISESKANIVMQCGITAIYVMENTFGQQAV